MKQTIITILLLSTYFSAIYCQNYSNERKNIRIGAFEDVGNLNVPLGAITKELNIDFSGYRDVQREQIGARISAIRYNIYQSNNALKHNTALVFYTNSSGLNAGTTDLIERMRISPFGNVGIGTATPQNKLDVKGKIRAEEVIIETGWADLFSTKNINYLV